MNYAETRKSDCSEAGTPIWQPATEKMLQIKCRFRLRNVGGFLLSLAVLPGMIQFSRGEESGVRIVGNVVYSAVGLRGGTNFVVHKEFVCEVLGSQWRIRTRNTDPAEDPKNVSSYTEALCDGTNTFGMTSYLPEGVSSLGGLTNTTREGKIKINQQARITGGIIPVPDQLSHAAPVWLAYASSMALKDLKDSKLPPLWPTPSQIQIPQLFKVDVMLDGKEPFLPTLIRFFSDGTTRTIVASGSPQIVRFPEPYSRGFVIAEFKSLQFTNVNGQSLPTQSSLKLFRPKRDGHSAEDLALAAEWQLNATQIERINVAPQAAAPFRLEFHNQPSLITDYRVPVKPVMAPVTYVSKSGELMETGSSRFQSLHRMALEREKQEAVSPTNTSASRIVILLVFVVTSLAFGALILRLALRKTGGEIHKPTS